MRPLVAARLTKAKRALRPARNSTSRNGSALRELERAPRLGTPVLLALDHARIAGEEPAALERAAQIGLEVHERLGNAVADGAGLPRQAAAGHGADDVIL